MYPVRTYENGMQLRLIIWITFDHIYQIKIDVRVLGHGQVWLTGKSIKAAGFRCKLG